jgi:fimbrial isopeptide formation D2 family protein/LPXTG-motif cell wall-anchored protein
MKHFKKLFAALLAAAIAVGMAGSALAAETTGNMIVVSDAPDGHTYQAYQIFAGTSSSGSDKLSNITWGSSVSENGQEKLLEKYGVSSAMELAELIENYDDGSDEVQAFADTIVPYLETSTAVTSSNDTGVCMIGGPAGTLDTGYYLVMDKVNSLKETKGTSYTSYILNVVNGVAYINVKSGEPTVEKKVFDLDSFVRRKAVVVPGQTQDQDYITLSGVNWTRDADSGEITGVERSSSVTGSWGDSADYAIGDRVPFLLTADIPESITSNYDSYELIFVDTMSDGLTWDEYSESAMAVSVVYFDNSGAEQTMTLDSDAYEFDCTNGELTVDIEDILSFGVQPTAVTVYYTAVLNENAALGSVGNDNSVYLEYSNNPNGTGTGKTAEDKVTVYTYQLVVSKVRMEDGTTSPLAGAEFTLTDPTGKTITPTVSDDGTTFTFTGLNDKQYILTETDAPDGYGTIDPITFTISATHSLTSDSPKLESLSVSTDDENAAFSVTSETDASTGSTTFGDITTQVVDEESSVTLPTTGGMGTTILYVVGGILVVGAGILLVVRKRMSRDE